MTLHAYVDGIGLLGPGLNGWQDGAAILTGCRAYTSAPTVLPVPSMLPAAERRRTGRVVKVALGVAFEATAAAAASPSQLSSVFSSSGADGYICHEIVRHWRCPAEKSPRPAFQIQSTMPRRDTGASPRAPWPSRMYCAPSMPVSWRDCWMQ